MNQRMWSGRILLKYGLIESFSLAVVVLLLMFVRQWIEIAPWLMWCLIGLWVLKDLILYPFVWRAYESGSQEGTGPMEGQCGIAKERLDPDGYIFVRGELWKAMAIDDGFSIGKGDHVRVKGSKGLLLLVEHERKGD